MFSHKNIKTAWQRTKMHLNKNLSKYQRKKKMQHYQNFLQSQLSRLVRIFELFRRQHIYIKTKSFPCDSHWTLAQSTSSQVLSSPRACFPSSVSDFQLVWFSGPPSTGVWAVCNIPAEDWRSETCFQPRFRSPLRKASVYLYEACR